VSQGDQERYRSDAERFRSDAIQRRDPTEQFASEEQSAYAGMPPVNILVTGQTGVGKSTLVNAVLRKPVARTGTGKPVTEHVRAWSVDGVPITLYDTPGIELGRDAGTVSSELINLIRSKRTEDISEHIHLLWYCVAGESRRIQDYEVELIRVLSAELPTILVMTQCLGPDDEAVLHFEQELIRISAEQQLGIDRGRPIKTLALARKLGPHTIESFGLDELVQRSFQLLPEKVIPAFVNAQIVDIDMKAREARKTVLWASGVAATIGAVPIPIPDAGPLLALQASMLARIAVQMGVEFDKQTRDFLIRGIIGSGAVAIIGRQAASFGLKLIPGLGSAINATVAGALTGALGEAFIRLCSEVLKRQIEGRPMPQEEMLSFLSASYKKLFAQMRKGKQP
jgi:uncharacterized protein (DUF697 family)/predicted GTPase